LHDGGATITTPGPAGLAPGSVAATWLLNYAGFRHVDGPGRGDTTYLVQRVIEVLEGGLTANRALTALTSQTFRTVEGQTVTVAEQMRTLPASEHLELDIRRSEFAAFRPDFGPAAAAPTVAVTLHRLPSAVANVSAFFSEVLTVEAPAGEADLRVSLAGGNPFPDSWPAVVDVRLSFPVPVTLTGTMKPLVSGRGVRIVDTAARLQAAPLRPSLAPPRAARAGERALDRPLEGSGFTPVLSWSAPALGRPTLYQVGIARLEATVDEPRQVTVATAYTAQTSLRLPPQLLQRGEWYRVEIVAIASERVGITSPRRNSLPRLEAACLTAPLSP
jgi:hypothetical protein